MKAVLLAALAIPSVLLAPAAWAGPSRGEGTAGYALLKVHPAFTPDRKAVVAAAATGAKACKAGGSVAFSARGRWAGSTGDDSPVQFPNLYLNDGEAFDVGSLFSTFTAPCDGLYFFTIDFMRDSFYGPPNCSAGVGTEDDIALYLTRNNDALGNSEALAGQSEVLRAGAAHSMVVRLTKRDVISVWVHSDGGDTRCLGLYSFNGYRVPD